MKLFIIYSLMSFYLTPLIGGLSNPALPVFLPFYDPHTSLLSSKMTFNERLIDDPTYESEFGVVLHHQKWNNIVNNDPGSLMKGVLPIPRDILFLDDVIDFSSTARKKSIDWSTTPTLFIAGHGAPGTPKLAGPPRYAKRLINQLEQITDVENIAAMIQEDLNLPLNYFGKISCLSCDSGLGRRLRPSLAAALSSHLHRLGYHKLVVEGTTGLVSNPINRHRVERLIEQTERPILRRFFKRNYQFVGNTNGITQWVFNEGSGIVTPFNHPEARKQFYNGREIAIDNKQ